MAITTLRFCEFNKPVAASIDCGLSPAGSRPVGFRPACSEIVLCVIAINVHKVSDELFLRTQPDARSRRSQVKRSVLMRTAWFIGSVLAVLAVLALSTRADNSGSWCAHYRNGRNNCGFQSFNQCQVAVWDVQGFCTRG
jgi:hypothetical protein